MKSMKKILSCVTALTLSAVMLSACGSDSSDGSEETSSEATASVASSSDAAAEENENAVDPNVPVNLDEGITDKMYNRALMNEGDTSRLAAAMKKAENGEEITVGVIGGSITQGSLASNQNNCYASKFFSWWSEKFPECSINTVNAGIGGTDSYLGVHRVDEQLLSQNPDVVIVEFSVNDTDKTMNKYSYDSLVRKILSAENNPAVILLFTTQEDGTSLQDVHKEIGFAYDLPMISYREAVYPEVAAGTLAWTDISPDNIHPNDIGHDMIGQLLGRYLDSVYENKDSADEPEAFTVEGVTNDYYKNARLVNASEITAVSSEGFEVGQNTVYSQFTDNWITTSGGTISFEVECQNLGIFFLKTTDGSSGTYEVYVDGQRKGLLEADFSGGWGNYGYPKQVVLAKDTEKHTVEIKPAEGSEDKGITILSLMIS
ncbi:MAG: SGNH/GDSL hydrolase family protein [Oscillospiraceae bacterium]|nr:SGNH/GDSL hydrolase family protein [Oscillospiraceae bacterium]